MFVESLLDWAHNSLLDNEEAQEYLTGRGVSRAQWVKHRLGYLSSPYDLDPSKDPDHRLDCMEFGKKHLRCDSCSYRAWSSVWRDSDDDGRKIQLVGERITGGIVFPLTTYAGNAVGFQVRSIREKSYDTFVIRKRPEGYFFGIGPNIGSIWSEKAVGLCEGPGDQLILERLVMPNVVALTTAGASLLQMKFLRRFVRRIYLILDLDDPGRKATRGFIEANSSQFDIIDIKYTKASPKCKDPGDNWRVLGDSKFAETFKKAIW